MMISGMAIGWIESSKVGVYDTCYTALIMIVVFPLTWIEDIWCSSGRAVTGNARSWVAEQARASGPHGDVAH